MVETIIHIAVGISAILLCLITVLLGATMAGRFGKQRINKTVFRSHKFLSISTGILVFLAFVFGLVAGELEFEGELEIENIHGIIGLSIFLLAMIQIIPSLLIKNRIKIKSMHRFIGLILLILMIIQLISGVSKIL